MSFDSSASAEKTPHWYETEQRVCYADTDQMGVVYYANYLRWFEIGRTEYCRQRGLNYRVLEKENQLFLTVAEAQCRYHASARYDDLVCIRVAVETLRRRTLSFLYEIVNKETGAILATGRTVHVLVGRDGRPVTFPAEINRFFE